MVNWLLWAYTVNYSMVLVVLLVAAAVTYKEVWPAAKFTAGDLTSAPRHILVLLPLVC